MESNRAVKIASRRRPRISQGDILVLTKGAGRYLVFFAHAEVEQVSESEMQTHDGLYQTAIDTSEWVTFDEGLSLNALRYSLTLVRNLEHPERHLRFGYRRFPEEDFETLKSGEVFVARTTYYELLLALPEQLRNGFLAEEAFAGRDGRFSLDGRFHQGRFNASLRRLYDFLLLRVIAVGVLLEQLSDLIEQVDLRADSGVGLAHIFAEEDQQGIPVMADNIVNQGALFRELLGGAPEQRDGQAGLAAVDSVLEAIASREGLPREAAFERLFQTAA